MNDTWVLQLVIKHGQNLLLRVKKCTLITVNIQLDATTLIVTVASCVRVIGNCLQLLDAPVWLFVLCEQLYW